VLTDATFGGTWTTSASGIITISAGGVVTPVTSGMAVITYTSTGGSYVTATVTVLSAPPGITGSSTVCAGSSVTEADTWPSGVWTSATPSIAVVGATSGVVTGLSYGTTTIIYNITSGCSVSKTVTVSPMPMPYSLVGGGSLCAGSSGSALTLSGSDAGISYQLYNASSTVGAPISGTGTALSFGSFSTPGVYTAVATSAGGCTTTMTGSATITVSPLPTAYAVTGGGSYCSGGTGLPIGITASSTGIAYQLYIAGVPMGTPIYGTGLPISFGTMTMAGTYSVMASDPATGCTASMSGSATVTVVTGATPAVSITATPGTTVCAGSTVSYTATPTSGGTSPTYSWTVGGLVVGTSSTYSYVPASGDVVSVTMASSLACATPSSASSSVTMTTDAATVTASSSAACGGVVTLTGSGAISYSWSPTTGLSCPTCSSATLTPSGTTTYSVIGTDAAGCTGTATVTVTGNTISGSITYSGGSSTDVFKVWLIQYNPADSSVTAEDSTTTCMASGTPYYEFSGEPAGSYMAKAALVGSVAGASGYIPTYSLSTPHWDSAATVTHASGADVLNITMVYGTVPAGPGFIGGNVFSGAGRGTSPDAPAVGMLIYLKNTAGNIITYTYTDATGAYSFGPIANGTYVIYPETYKYYTTSATVTLSAGAEIVAAVDFKQHTSNGTITPTTVTPSSNPVLNTNDAVSVYPNPAVNTLNIEWGNQATGNAAVTITDITGRNVYSANVDLNTASGLSKIDISSLQNGLYLISVKSGSVSYNGKIAVQK